MAETDTRHAQRFPVLDAAALATAQRFASGPIRRFDPGQIVFELGERSAPVWLILDGSIDAVRRDGLGHEQAIVTQTAGQFTGEVSQLAGRASLAEGRAGPQGCSAVPIDTPHLRALMIGAA